MTTISSIKALMTDYSEKKAAKEENSSEFGNIINNSLRKYNNTNVTNNSKKLMSVSNNKDTSQISGSKKENMAFNNTKGENSKLTETDANKDSERLQKKESELYAKKGDNSPKSSSNSKDVNTSKADASDREYKDTEYKDRSADGEYNTLYYLLAGLGIQFSDMQVDEQGQLQMSETDKILNQLDVSDMKNILNQLNLKENSQLSRILDKLANNELLSNLDMSNLKDLLDNNIEAINEMLTSKGQSDINLENIFKEDYKELNTDLSDGYDTKDINIQNNNTFITKDKDIKEEDIIKTVEQFVQNIITFFNNTLNISSKDLKQSMETLGVTALDLGNSDVLKDILMMSKGVEDISAAFTSEEFAKDMMSLNRMLGENDGEIKDLLEQNKDLLEGANLEKVLDDTLENLDLQKEVSTVQNSNKLKTDELQANQTDKSNTNQNGISPDKQIDVNNLYNQENSTKASKIHNVISQESGIQTQLNKDKNDNMLNSRADNNQEIEVNNFSVPSFNEGQTSQDTSFSQSSSNLMQDNQADYALEEVQLAAYETFINNLENAVNVGNIQEAAETSQVARMREIVEQIVEQINANVTTDTTTLEMQLNPHNLGKVNLSISSEGGVVSAKFIVENQTAKEAIESQLEMLKEKFELQGIRVNEVEVSISDYDLSRNMGGNEANQREYQGQGQRRRRNLKNIDEINQRLNLDLDEISPEIMLDNSSVEYRA